MNPQAEGVFGEDLIRATPVFHVHFVSIDLGVSAQFGLHEIRICFHFVYHVQFLLFQRLQLVFHEGSDMPFLLLKEVNVVSPELAFIRAMWLGFGDFFNFLVRLIISVDHVLRHGVRHE